MSELTAKIGDRVYKNVEDIFDADFTPTLDELTIALEKNNALLHEVYTLMISIKSGVLMYNLLQDHDALTIVQKVIECNVNNKEKG